MTDEVTRMARRLVLLTLITCAALAGAAGGAQAVVVSVGGQPVSYQPLRGATGRGQAQPNVGSQTKPARKSKGVTWHGGPVMTSNTNYAIYWDPAGAPSFPAGYEAGVDNWFEDLEHDSGGLLNTDSVLSQYHGEGSTFANYDSHFAGALTDTDPYPANGCSSAPTCLTRAQLETELSNFVQAHGLPADLTHMYFLLTPEEVESCFEEQGHQCSAGAEHAFYCMYHDFIEVPKGGTIIFADAPYVPGLRCGDEKNTPNNKVSDEELAGGLVHEHSEAVTDPTLKAWYETQHGNEVADKCRTFEEATEFGAPLGTAEDGSKYNQVVNSDKYWYQQMWSNEAGACRQRAGEAPTVRKIAPKTGPAGGGTAVTITGTGFTNTSTVAFGVAAGTEVIFHSATSITATSPAGSGTVDVRVTNALGTSPIVSKDHFKYKQAK
jgi:IPT/TIG domain